MKTIIFDFDGTLADSIPLIEEVINEVLVSYKYPPIKKEEILKLSNESSIKILLRSGVPFYKLPFMFMRGRKLFKKKSGSLKPIEGIINVIKKLKEDGYLVGIITSNTKDSVEGFLTKNNFPQFDFLYTGDLIWKERIIKRCLNKYKIDSSDAIYVGDEIRDVEASKKAGIKCIAVGWGFNTAISLQKAGSEKVVGKTSELYQAIYSLEH